MEYALQGEEGMRNTHKVRLDQRENTRVIETECDGRSAQHR